MKRAVGGACSRTVNTFASCNADTGTWAFPYNYRKSVDMFMPIKYKSGARDLTAQKGNHTSKGSEVKICEEKAN